jgi:hypothetical protein
MNIKCGDNVNSTFISTFWSDNNWRTILGRYIKFSMMEDYKYSMSKKFLNFVYDIVCYGNDMNLIGNIVSELVQLMCLKH